MGNNKRIKRRTGIFLKFIKISKEQRINRHSNITMLVKALNNAAVGFPISALLNIIFTLPISKWFIISGMGDAYYPFILGVPFIAVSVTRQYLIDYYIAAYNINLDPSYLIRLLIKRLLSTKLSSGWKKF
jgi:hypothetical protein